MIDIFGANGYIRYFCTRFPRDGKPWNWHSDRNGYWTPANFSSFALILTKNNAAEKKFEKKNFRNIWKLSGKVLTFAPAFQEMVSLEIDLLTETVLRTSSSFISLSQRETTRKRKKKKTFEIIWKICLKVLTFASAFWKEKQLKKKRSLKNLHKQYK